MLAAAQTADPLRTRPHFNILDGMRGIAALSVVIYHFGEIVMPDYNKLFIAHAYLAVDFFFCLSGFVIAYAYDSRLEKIGVAPFLLLRLIRLHPLVIIGSLLGLLTFLFDPFSHLHDGYSSLKTFLMFLTSSLMIPYPVVRERYFNLFHLNPPSWSLFWEYIANLLYAGVLFRLRNKVLWILVLMAATALCWESFRSGFLGMGWGGDNVVAGAIRVSYSFLVGMLAYRSGWVIKSRLGFVPLALLLAAAFLVPYRKDYTAWTDLLEVLFYFPFLVALGAGAQLRPSLARLCKFSGDISYPLYMTHYPFIWVFYSYLEAKKPSGAQLALIIPCATGLLILLAYGILRFVDAPIRKLLKERLKTKVQTS